MLGFDERGCILRSRYTIPLKICGESTQTVQADVCLLHNESTICLLVQEDNSELSAESKVIRGNCVVSGKQSQPNSAW